MIIYFNPNCSKCNEALDILKNNHCEFEIRDYLQKPPLVNELKELVAKLKCRPEDLIRKNEPLFEQKYKGKTLNDEQWLEALAKDPILIERPIVVNGFKAIIGRPPKLVLNII